MNRPIEKDYTSQVAYTRALEAYCDSLPQLEQPAQQALNKMAENARELGLDYEPDIPFGDNNPGLPWDEVPQAFNDWWNADYDPTGNPFGKDTHAYWAWAGWKAAEQPAQQQPVPWSQALEDVWAIALHLEDVSAEQPAQQESVAVHQFRNRYVTDWYDGVPDHQDGHGPYEVRTLYTFPQAQRKPLTDEEIQECWYRTQGDAELFARAIEAKLKENT